MKEVGSWLALENHFTNQILASLEKGFCASVDLLCLEKAASLVRDFWTFEWATLWLLISLVSWFFLLWLRTERVLDDDLITVFPISHNTLSLDCYHCGRESYRTKQESVVCLNRHNYQILCYICRSDRMSRGPLRSLTSLCNTMMHAETHRT